MRQADIIVLGAGAAGMMAAITAAQTLNNKKQILILEKLEVPGKKLLATGNGRCNLTNLSQDIKFYHTNASGEDKMRDKEMIRSALDNFDEMKVCQFYQSHGMMTVNKNGYIYPRSLQAGTVCETLVRICEGLGISFVYGEEITEIRKKKDRLILSGDSGRMYETTYVILATGSPASVKGEYQGYCLAKGMGHKIVHPLPALGALIVNKERIAGIGKAFFKTVTGVRTEVSLYGVVNGEETEISVGELQLTDYGLSGIVVFNISRFFARGLHNKKKCQVICDFLKDFTVEDILKQFESWENQKLTLLQALSGFLNQKLAKGLIMALSSKYYQVSTTQSLVSIPKDSLRGFVTEMKSFSFEIEGVNDLSKAQVCSGGIKLSECSQKLESNFMPGVYFAGEILDVDGICGGYNLQWAWSSAHLVGEAVAEEYNAQSELGKFRGRREV